MAYGYDTVASSATMAMPAFLLSFGAVNPETQSLYAPSIWSALWTAMANLGQAIGSFAIGPLAERIGRRYAIVTFALLSCAGVAVQFTATTRWALLIGKMFNGVCIGGIMACGTTYAADVSDHTPLLSYFISCSLLVGLIQIMQRDQADILFPRLLLLDCVDPFCRDWSSLLLLCKARLSGLSGQWSSIKRPWLGKSSLLFSGPWLSYCFSPCGFRSMFLPT